MMGCPRHPLLPAYHRWSNSRPPLQPALILVFSWPGVQLSEVALAQQYGVSRNTLREAFRLLARDGLVEHVPHRGVFVRTMTTAHDLKGDFTLIDASWNSAPSPMPTAMHTAPSIACGACVLPATMGKRGCWRRTGSMWETPMLIFTRRLWISWDPPF